MDDEIDKKGEELQQERQHRTQYDRKRFHPKILAYSPWGHPTNPPFKWFPTPFPLGICKLVYLGSALRYPVTNHVLDGIHTP